MKSAVNHAHVAKNSSFKTNTLIAAIGMSIAVGYSLIVQFIGNFTDIYFYVHPIRMQALWRLQSAVWWASVLIFFWGMFRYPHQLPSGGKWSKRLAFAMIGIFVILCLDGLFYTSTSDPLWLKIICYSLRLVANSGYVAALWWCFAKSDKQPTHLAMRYISLSLFLLSCVALGLGIVSGIMWWFGMNEIEISVWSMYPLCALVYAGTAAGILASRYVRPSVRLSPDKAKRRFQHLTIAGWIFLATFVTDVILLAAVIVHPVNSEWLELAGVFFFILCPLLAGIYLIVACRSMQKVYYAIQNEHQPDPPCTTLYLDL